MRRNRFPPDTVGFYCMDTLPMLSAVTVTGLIYNIGLAATPWFEGQLAQMLCGILEKTAVFGQMMTLAAFYVLTIAVVQFSRFLKRLYVRKFANQINRSMKLRLYRSLLSTGKAELTEQSVGSAMTKSIADVDTCAEGIRKFVTEVFDTGVALIAYLVMLCIYDWRLTCICMVFPPVAWFMAERMKKRATAAAGAFKQSTAALSNAALDRISNAVTYRVYGQDENRSAMTEKQLEEYEKTAVRAGILETGLQPVYQVIAMTGALFILWLGGKNVTGTGWVSWDIAAFTAFLSCFAKLSVKSAKIAKLFNSVQKARVSWIRIKPNLRETALPEERDGEAGSDLTVEGLSFSYPGKEPVFSALNLKAASGQIIGITGPVACGKSTLGKAFLCEYSYSGSIRFGEEEMKDLIADNRAVVGYVGHDPELLQDSIRNNVLMGKEGSPWPYLEAVRMADEVRAMPRQEQTPMGGSGEGLSGGQQARIALARALCHKRPVLILDDPFSAVDKTTEKEIFENLRREMADGIVLLISHRLSLFPSFDQVIWMENGACRVSTHAQLIASEPHYAALYRAQTEGEVEHHG